MCRTQQTLSSGHRQKLSTKQRARIACHLRRIIPQIHIHYNENPLNITKHNMSACVFPYIFEALCVQNS